MITRRQMLVSAMTALTGGMLLKSADAASNKNQSHTHAIQSKKQPHPANYARVVTPNGSSLPYKMKNGVKEFHLVAEAVEREFAPGMKVKCWGYNGQTPGPTIEAVEGDRVRILVTNKLPEHTTIHWHGIFLPNGMDGVEFCQRVRETNSQTVIIARPDHRGGGRRSGSNSCHQ